MESVGGDISYYTGNNSFGVAAEALSEDFDRALDVLADVLLHPTFPDAMLARERDIQLAEIKAEQDQLLRAGQQLLREALFAKHPYRLNVLGKPGTVAKLTREDLTGFHRRYVTPGNMVLTVFGNVNAGDVRKKIEAKFGAMKPVKMELPRTLPEKLPASVRKETIRPKEQAVLLIGFIGADVYSKDRYALELLDELYSGLGSRVFLRIRDELGLAYYVGAYQMLGLDSGYFAFYAGTTPGNVATCEQEIFAELAKLEAGKLTEEELDRAKNSLIGQRRVRMQDNAELSTMVGLDELLGFGHEYFKTMDGRYRAVTLDDIKTVANTYFASKPSAVVVVKPPVAKE
jgi:zinc protease